MFIPDFELIKFRFVASVIEINLIRLLLSPNLNLYSRNIGDVFNLCTLHCSFNETVCLDIVHLKFTRNIHTCINICLKGILLLVDFLKDVLESTIVSLQDSVFRTHVQGPFLHNGILETGVGKSSDALKHTHITLNYLLTYD